MIEKSYEISILLILYICVGLFVDFQMVNARVPDYSNQEPCPCPMSHDYHSGKPVADILACHGVTLDNIVRLKLSK